MKTVRLVIAAALIAAAAIVVPLTSPSMAPKAEAGGLCDTLRICGDVYNEKRSECSIFVSNNWKDGYLAGKWQLVPPGTHAHFRDVDGFVSPDKCRHKYSFNYGLTWSKWTRKAVKINDATNAKVISKIRPKFRIEPW